MSVREIYYIMSEEIYDSASVCKYISAVGELVLGIDEVYLHVVHLILQE